MTNLAKYNNAYIQALNEQLAVYTTIDGKNESPMWFALTEIKEDSLYFQSTQNNYQFFSIPILDNDYFDFIPTQDYFRQLKYNNCREFWPTVYYERFQGEKPRKEVVELVIKEDKEPIQETDYNKQAADFLTATGTTFTATYKTHDHYFSDDKETRDIYIIVLKNQNHRYRFLFGQSLNDSDYGNTPPTPYDVLACLTKYDCGDFENFCSDFGYDIDSRKAYKTYKAVLKEWKNVERLFTSERLEQLQEIN